MFPTVVAITGVSGSGKTRLSRYLLNLLSRQMAVAYLCEDSYYRDQSHLTVRQRLQTNYDHPDALEHELLVQHLVSLRHCHNVEVPRYDYSQHNRRTDTEIVQAGDMILVEGALLLSQAEIRKQIDCAIHLDEPLELCLKRRIQRDVVERGRTEASVVSQFAATVRPMYFEFVEPSKQYADILLSDNNGVELIDALAEELARNGQSALASMLQGNRELD